MFGRRRDFNRRLRRQLESEPEPIRHAWLIWLLIALAVAYVLAKAAGLI